MKKFYSLFLALVLGIGMSYAQNVAIVGTPVTTEPDVYDDNVLKIQGWVEDAWTGITTELVNSASLADMVEADYESYDAIVITENGGSAAIGKISPIGIRACPIVSLKAYAIKRAYPQWNLIPSTAGTWYAMVKDSSMTNYDYVYSGIVAAEHPIFGNYWGVGDEFIWNTLYNENQGDEAHIQCFDLDSSTSPGVVEASTMIATNKFAVDETGSAVDGWLWTMDAVADSGYKKTVIWGVHHMYMDNVTDTFRIILQNSLAWVLDHEIPNVYEPIAISDYSVDNMSLAIYPNPVVSTATVKFNLAQPMTVSAIIRDALGRVVSVRNGNYQAGSQEIAIDGSLLSSGMYVCQLVGEGCTQSKSFIIE